MQTVNHSSRSYTVDGPAQYQTTRTTTNYGPNGTATTQSVYGNRPMGGTTTYQSSMQTSGNMPSQAPLMQQSSMSQAPVPTENPSQHQLQGQSYVTYSKSATQSTNQVAYNSGTHPDHSRQYASQYPTQSQGTYGLSYQTAGAEVIMSESAQRYVPIGTQPVTTFPHNIKMIYDPKLVPAFMAPPQVSVNPGYIGKWAMSGRNDTGSSSVAASKYTPPTF